MSDDLNCPFCGSQNLKSGGDDKFVGVWCLDCQATGPNHYGRFDWNTRADTAAAQVAAAYERAANLCVDQFQAHLDLVITGNLDNARNRESAANMAEKLSHEIRALATDTQADALELVRKEAALKALADMGQEWDADTAAAQVAAAYERAADEIDCGCQERPRVLNAQTKIRWYACGRDPCGALEARAIRALATDEQTDALEQVRKETERAGYERGVREALDDAIAEAEKIADTALSAAPEQYQSGHADGADRVQHAIRALLDNPTPTPDEQTEAAQELAFRKAVSS